MIKKTLIPLVLAGIVGVNSTGLANINYDWISEEKTAYNQSQKDKIKINYHRQKGEDFMNLGAYGFAMREFIKAHNFCPEKGELCKDQFEGYLNKTIRRSKIRNLIKMADEFFENRFPEMYELYEKLNFKR